MVDKFQQNCRRMWGALEQRPTEHRHKFLWAALTNPDVAPRKRKLCVVRVHAQFQLDRVVGHVSVHTAELLTAH
jgi:hypothetical protein